MEGEIDHYTVKLLYEVPMLADECCLLLNHEWKRSHQARMRSLNLTSDKYPLNIILLKKFNAEKVEIAGHCRVSSILAPDSHGPAVFLESVLIAPELRRKGLGKRLLSEVENYLKKRGVRSIYLYTMGQEVFYGKLGYTPCQPVDVFSSVPDLDFPELPKPYAQRRRSYIGQNGNAPKPPPPPPPPAPPRIPANDRSFYKGSKTFMHKIIFPFGEFRP